MEYFESAPSLREGSILCCQCGANIQPNPSNMCVGCIRNEVDITEGIPKQVTIYFCKGCERYLQPPTLWIHCALESRELLALCLKKLKGLNRVRLVDAGFIWTEPHSKRLKVKLTVQQEVLGGAILQQVFVVEFTVNHQMCDDCHRTEAKDFWRALVQIRQKVSHKKTFFYLEQLILRHRAHSSAVGVKAKDDGLDFFYAQKQDAWKMVEFLSSAVPCKHQMAKRLISHDIHSNIYNYKHTYSIEIAPICKDDVVCLPKKLAHSLGGISCLCICNRVTENIHLIDPFTAQIAELSSRIYWREPFGSICTTKQLQEYTVMDKEFIADKDRHQFSGQGPMSQKHVLADVWVVKTSELGLSDAHHHCRTHIGHLLKAGDTVLGFDIANTNVNDKNFEKLQQSSNLPDVIIVKKIYADKSVRNRKRKWKLKHLNADTEVVAENMEGDYIEFLEDLEEDSTYRKNVNIFIDKDKLAIDTDDTDDEQYPRITLQEMLDDLRISEDATGGEGAAMME